MSITVITGDCSRINELLKPAMEAKEAKEEVSGAEEEDKKKKRKHKSKKHESDDESDSGRKKRKKAKKPEAKKAAAQESKEPVFEARLLLLFLCDALVLIRCLLLSLLADRWSEEDLCP